MRTFNSFLLVVVIIAVAVGLSRSWFTVWSGRQPDGNRIDVNLTIDPAKVKADMETVKDKAESVTRTSPVDHSTIPPTTTTIPPRSTPPTITPTTTENLPD